MAERALRYDVQGLRAIAVTLVLVNHFWPYPLAGGYVGVDVFFVISGFLITSGLIRRPPQAPRDLLSFWARRIRRLLPAACLVLLIALIVSFVWAPRTMHLNIVMQTIGAAVYGQNWVLAATATDYFAASSSHTPIQHYWSLSVEEQFYLVWPVLIMFLAWLTRRRSERKFWIPVGLGILALASLVFSVWYSHSSPTAAYFITPTRMWELAAGGLVAVAANTGWQLQSARLRAVLAWVGVIMIMVSAFWFSSATPFPSFTALLPVGGAALAILVAADDVKWSPNIFWRWWPVQTAGDISYSIYLWHWPAIVLVPMVMGRNADTPMKWGIIGGVLIVSYLTKRFVEDGPRFSPVFVKSLRNTFLMGLTISLTVVGCSLDVRSVELRLQDEEAQLALIASMGQQQLGNHSDSRRCIGAGVVLNPECATKDSSTLLYQPSVIANNPWIMCNTMPPYTDVQRCHFGATSGDKHILLIGNSHAMQWAPVLDDISKDYGWVGDTLTGAGCSPDIGIQISREAGATDACAALGDEQLQEAISGKYDLVILSAERSDALVGPAEKTHWASVTASQQAVYDELKAAGVNVLVIRDTPAPYINIPDCIAAHTQKWSACNYRDSTNSTSQDPLYDITMSNADPKILGVAANNLLCNTDGVCPAVIGGVIVFMDDNHLSAQFAQSLRPVIEPAMTQLLQ